MYGCSSEYPRLRNLASPFILSRTFCTCLVSDPEGKKLKERRLVWLVSSLVLQFFRPNLLGTFYAGNVRQNLRSLENSSLQQTEATTIMQLARKHTLCGTIAIVVAIVALLCVGAVNGQSAAQGKINHVVVLMFENRGTLLDVCHFFFAHGHRTRSFPTCPRARTLTSTFVRAPLTR